MTGNKVDVVSENKALGIVRVKIAGNYYAIQYTWDELAELESTFGGEVSSQLGNLPILLAVACIGMRKHHADMTEESLKALSPAVFPLHAAVSLALRYSYFGDVNPDDAIADIQGTKKKRRPFRKFLRWLSSKAFSR
jgi:hypothetical protein